MDKQILHTPEGVRDIYGDEFLKKELVENQIKNNFLLYGYQQIQTPSFEFFDVFSKETGTIPSKDLYKFFDREGNTLVLRPDFTPSIARCAAKYMQTSDFPVRFFYQGNTFANTSEHQGKLKETTQIGGELIGDPSVEAEAEMILLMVENLKRSGLDEFQISIGEVDFFKGICQEAGINEENEYELREYISGKNIFGVREILDNLKLSDKHREILLMINDLYGTEEVLLKAKKYVSNETSLKSLERLEKLFQRLKIYKIENYITFDLGMLSKYRYYTGVIFKAYTYGVGDAIAKGGRYDTLLERFGRKTHAIGFSILIDELLNALTRQKIDFPLVNNSYGIYYAENQYEAAAKKAMELRNSGLYTELIPFSTRDIASQDVKDLHTKCMKRHTDSIFFHADSTVTNL